MPRFDLLKEFSSVYIPRNSAPSRRRVIFRPWALNAAPFALLFAFIAVFVAL